MIGEFTESIVKGLKEIVKSVPENESWVDLNGWAFTHNWECPTCNTIQTTKRKNKSRGKVVESWCHNCHNGKKIKVPESLWGAVMKKKYLVFPGTVVSRNDGDKHHIGFEALCDLYGVDENECLDARRFENQLSNSFRDSLIELHPRYSGDYPVDKVLR